MNEARATKLLRTVLREHAYLDADRLLQTALPILFEVVPCQGVVAHWINFADRHEVTHAHPIDFHLAMNRDMPAYLEHMHQHPIVGSFAQQDGHDARVLSDFVGWRTWHRTTLYNEYFRPLGIEDQLAVQTSSHDGTWGTGLSFSRSRRRFSFGVRRISEEFGHDLRQAVELADLRMLSQLEEEVRQQLSEGHDRCVVAVDRHRMVRNVSGPFRDVVTALLNDLERGRTLPDALVTEIAVQARLNRQQRHRRSTGHAVLGLEAFTVLWLPATGNDDGLLVVERSRDLKQRLTPRQAQILRLAGEGLTARYIGRHLGLSDSTVNNHLYEIHRRLGVDSTAAAVRMLR